MQYVGAAAAIHRAILTRSSPDCGSLDEHTYACRDKDFREFLPTTTRLTCIQNPKHVLHQAETLFHEEGKNMCVYVPTHIR